MKIRSKAELIDLLDADLAWRKKELTNLKNDINTATMHKVDTAVRAGTVLLYAHWEGFTKSAAEKYLLFVKSKKLKLNELSNCFLAIAIRQQLTSFTSTSKSTVHVQLLDFIYSTLNDRANINTDKVIKTESNLNYSILREILTTIGIDCTPYELKENLIDGKLIHYRNTIAHGHDLIFDRTEYSIIHSEILNMLIDINNRIQNAAMQDEYKR
ncbi:MAG TPA: MAE_28990/MAE_18760 family HEPN-like nuclease [Saprospiraceae bacterium]|nr:MAE_28990/MAE_18760 family HEPN-like nuclease [Saprospiraceae bacterium]